MRWIAIVDTGVDPVEPREKWTEIEATEPRLAAVDFAKTVDTIGEFDVLVKDLDEYERNQSFIGMLHRYTLIRKPAEERKAEFEEKREAKIERLQAAATSAKHKASALYEHAKQMADIIPFGQPILVGHHSEHRDRRYRDRIGNTFRASFQAYDKAEYYARRAKAAAANSAVRSEDPEAVQKLVRKVEEAKTEQEMMKACNAAIKKHAQAGAEAQIKALIELGRTEQEAHGLLKPDFCKRIGFASYQLQNNGANIRRMEKRIEELRQAQDTPALSVEGDKARFEDDPPGNRVRLFFPGKPAKEIRERLQSFGFRWAPSIGAWQAFRSYRTIEAAKAEAGITL